jgi:asparagine synthase (glutamine-hydrolysing)
MSAIAGVWTLGARNARALLSGMVPDIACGTVLSEGRLALGCNSPFGLAAAHASPIVVVADARLDEPDAMHAADSIAEAFERDGERCSDRLSGDFAFMVFDAHNDRLFLARDVMGTKPLYYARFGEVFAFASALGPLLAVPGISQAPDERALVDYIGGFPEDEHRTAFAAIRRLPPACNMVVSREAIRIQEYWSPDPTRELRLGSDDEYAEALRSELERAVLRRLPHDGACAVLLSGGLDSSSLACLAHGPLARFDQALITASAVFETDRECDESGYQRDVVARTNAEHVEVLMEQVSAGTDLSEALRVFREPAPVGDHWMAWPLLEAASKRRARVAFTGVDGDRVVSHGLGRREELARAGQWRELWAEIRQRGSSRVSSVRAVAGQALASRLSPAWVDAIDRLRHQAEVGHEPALRLIHPLVLERSEVRERLRAAYQRPLSTRDAHAQALRRADRTSDLDLFHPLADRFRLEVRHPFFDRRLVELCLSLPSEQKLRGGVSRFVLREAMRGLLPESVRTRTSKAFFDAGFTRWAERVLRDERNRKLMNLENLSPYVDVALVRKSLAGPVGALPMDLAWRCVVVSAWLEGLARGRK